MGQDMANRKKAHGTLLLKSEVLLKRKVVNLMTSGTAKIMSNNNDNGWEFYFDHQKIALWEKAYSSLFHSTHERIIGQFYEDISFGDFYSKVHNGIGDT
jgi:hypothetical protein